ncbi:PHP domain-containing protein [Christensenella tenuis]|uniref:PHP domain-containing protein n=1 Tax=Christensenella tenuis TaxID=2763033 RepID=A0ABR7EGB7_9FIRM|nr:PHP domain-containing protein [Christensenella tenuis]MBC5648776.1 PHP domain-containing protein [Christensenella tenuis]
MIDLHMHSTASDGTDTPKEIITKCRKLGLKLSAITDHDTMDSQPEAISTAKELKVRYLAGVEFSVRHTGELHILGYGMDTENKELIALMDDLRGSRVERVHEIIRVVQEHGMKIDFEDVERCAKGNTLGRPHVALALIEKGYASDLQDAFTRYLNEEGSCYVQRRKLNPQQAIEMILKTGGIPVLAHPKFVRTDDIEMLTAELKRIGLGGIEAYYPAHSNADVERYLGIAKRHGLLVTEGSDYHGAMRSYAAIACEKRTGPYLDESIKILTEKYAI